jgi:hypothetical protein
MMHRCGPPAISTFGWNRAPGISSSKWIPTYSSTTYPSCVEQLTSALRFFRIDFDPGHQPSFVAVAIATVLSLAGSLLADAALVAIGQHVFPSTRGYGHFQLSDYGKLTVIGVLIACIAWPVVTRITSSPRWVFFRMAIVVTVVLWAPDVYILVKGQPPRAVAVLMVMHLAIAIVTYNSLVHIAKPRPLQGRRTGLRAVR